MSDIFREIDEELRRDNLLKLWQRYGRYVIGVVVLALLIAGTARLDLNGRTDGAVTEAEARHAAARLRKRPGVRGP